MKWTPTNRENYASIICEVMHALAKTVSFSP